MYLVMKSVSCSMYILVFLEYSNSIGLSFIAAPRPAGPQPRDGLQRAPHRLAARSVLVSRRRLGRREDPGSRHPPPRNLDQDRPVHLDRVGDELADLGGVLRPPADGAVGLSEPDEIGVVQFGRELPAPVLVEVARDVAVGVIVED